MAKAKIFVCSRTILAFASLLWPLSAAESWADTLRLEKVVNLLGIDAGAQAKASQVGEAAVEHLVAFAIRSHPSLKVEAAQLMARQSELEGAEGYYQPELRLAASSAKIRAQDVLADLKTRRDESSLSLSLSENIWRGGQDAGRVDTARQNEKIAQISQKIQLEAVAFMVRKAALDFNYRSMRQVIDEASLADALELSALTERKFNAGQNGKIDIHFARMRASAAKSTAVRASIQARQARQLLIDKLGPQLNSDEFLVDLNMLAQRVLFFSLELPESASEPNLSFAEQKALALQDRAKISLNQGYKQRYLPQLDLLGNVSRSLGRSWLENQTDQKIKTSHLDMNLQLQLSWNLWDQTLDHQNSAAAGEKIAAEAQYETLHFETKAEAGRMRSYIIELQKSLLIAKDAYTEAGLLYAAQTKLFNSGLIGIQSLLDAEREQRNAIGAWHENVYELQFSLLRWQTLQRGYLAQ